MNPDDIANLSSPPAEKAPAIQTLTAKTLGGLKVSPVTDSNKFLNMLVYGDPGTGKTVLSGSSAVVSEMAPVLFIDIEGGTMSLQALYPSVDVVRITTWEQMQDVYDELYRGKSGYKTVVLDSLTEIANFAMARIMDDLIAEKPGADPDVPGLREWGKNSTRIRALVRGFRDLPINTIFTALVKEDRNARTGITTKKPSLSGKLALEVAGFVDVVLYMYLKRVGEENKRLLLSVGTESEIAKDRSGKLPPVVESPTMAMLYDMMKPNEPIEPQKKEETK